MTVLRYPKPRVLGALGNTPPRQLVIEASAGTGKTYTLEHSIVELLLVKGIPIEKLLVVTFTERATYDMRERIRALLKRIVAGQVPPGTKATDPCWEIGAAEMALLERALLTFDQAPIFTIHGFCQRVLTENAFLAHRLFEQELIDSRTVFGAGFKTALRHELATEPTRRADLAAWLDAHTVDELEGLLYEVNKQRAEVRPQLDLKALDKSFTRLRDGVKLGRIEAVKEAVEKSKLHKGTAKAVIKRLEQLKTFLDDPVATGSLVGLHASGALSDILGYLLDADRRAGIEEKVPDSTKLLGVLDGIAGSLVTLEAAAAQVFLPVVQERVRREKAAKGLFDFHDMLELVGDALRTSPLLVERLRQRFDHALIDEFQDTDEIQWGVFEQIFVSSPAHGLWVIADPKQAIYSFRGADVFAYLAARKRLLGAGEPVHLVQNFRSTGPLIDAYNTIFDQKAPQPFFRGRIRYDAPVTCGNPELVAEDADGKPLAPVHVFDLVSPTTPLYADDVRRILGRQIAAEIRHILDAGVKFGVRGDTKRVEPSDIFVLTRSGRDGDEIARYLAEERLPFAFYKQEGLFQTAEADDIYRVLCAVDDPSDRTRRLRAWMTPFFGVTLEQLAAGEPPGDHVHYRKLSSWQRLAERQEFERLFASLVEDTGLLRREILLAPSERRLTNYLHILEVLLETVGRSRLDLRELASLLRAWIDGERSPQGEDGNVQRLESDAQAVQIMTLHKSKGLEAAFVFLYGGYTDPKSRDLHVYHEPGAEPRSPQDEAAAKLQTVVYHDEADRRVVHVGPLTPEIAQLVREEADDEERRLLYVAITRAMARVYLPAFGSHTRLDNEGNEVFEWDFPRLGGCSVHLAERLDALIHDQEPPTGFEVERVELDGDRAGTAAKKAPSVTWSPPGDLLALPVLDAMKSETEGLRENHAPLLVTSYSRMKAGFTPTAAEIEAELLSEASEVPERAPEPERDDEDPRGGARTGTFLHEVLEHLSFETLRETPQFDAWRLRDDVRRLFGSTMGHHGIPQRFLVGSQRLIFRALTADVPLGHSVLRGGLATRQHDLRELEFTYPIPEEAHLELPFGSAFEVERGFIRGFIDYIFEHEERTYLLDWKSDTLGEYSLEAMKAHVDSEYRLQLEVYSLALARMLGVTSAAQHEKRFGGVLYVFLRGVGAGTGLYFERPDFDAIRRFERNLVAFEYH